MKKLALQFSVAALSLGLLLPQAARADDNGDAPPIFDSEDNGSESSDELQPVPEADEPEEPTGLEASDAGGSLYGHAVDPNGVHFPEWAHHRYLQSRTAGEAEYTDYWNRYHAMQSPWHGHYYNARWGRPLALVVPPTADSQVKWGWGVGSTEVVPIYHQFHRGNPPGYPARAWGRFRMPPYWPSHTDQFGVYPVRGPW